MKRHESNRARRRGIWMAFELGDLERYGVLALAACLVLGIAYLLQTMNGVPPPFQKVGFSGDRGSPASGDDPADLPADPRSGPRDTGEPRAETPAPEARAADAPGGGEIAVTAAAPTRPRRVGPRRADFDFFEPPVKVAGKPAPIAPPPPGTTGEARVVVVQKGETLQRIAARELGDASRWRVLIEWNPGLDPKRLKRGQELRLPPSTRAAPARTPPAARLHEVAPDDTLQSLAERYYGDRARWIDLLEANRDQLRGPADLKVGSKIRIP